MRPHLRLIHQSGDMPQLVNPEVPEPDPTQLLAFTDRVHDAGHVELEHMVLDQFLKMQRLVATASTFSKSE